MRSALVSALLLGACTSAVRSQTASAPSPASRPVPPPRNSIFLDPAHGGDDLGARLPDGTVEKDVTLALADRIRLQLTSFNIPVFLARDATSGPPPAPAPTPDGTTAQSSTTAPVVLTPDQRAGLANHAHPLACLVIHATASGSGVHLITADLPPPEAPADPDRPGLTPWLSAQAASLAQSDRLASTLLTSLSRAGLPVHRFRANLSPLSSLTCPAVILELAPLSRSQSPGNATYQSRTAQAIATALLFFRGEVLPPTPEPAPTSPAAAGSQP